MGKIKVKRKSTLIDMTAMSDVTVLLLTFFMLTSTFLQKEPTQVVTPPSVSTQKIQSSNVAQVLVATSANDKDTPKVYISVIGEANPDIPEEGTYGDLQPGAWGSENLRKEILKNAIALYMECGGKDPVRGKTGLTISHLWQLIRKKTNTTTRKGKQDESG